MREFGGTRDFSEYDHRCDIHIAMLYICPCRDVCRRVNCAVLLYEVTENCKKIR